MGRQQFDTALVKQRCENKLGIEFRDGKEYNGWFIHEGVKVGRVTVAKGRKDLPPKTYKSIASQLKISEEQLDALIECPLKLNGYVEDLRRQQVIRPKTPKPAPTKASKGKRPRRKR